MASVECLQAFSGRGRGGFGPASMMGAHMGHNPMMGGQNPMMGGRGMAGGMPGMGPMGVRGGMGMPMGGPMMGNRGMGMGGMGGMPPPFMQGTFQSSSSVCIEHGSDQMPVIGVCVLAPHQQRCLSKD